MLIRCYYVLPVQVTLAGNTACLTTRKWVNVTQQLESVSHLDLEVRPSYLVSTSAVTQGGGVTHDTRLCGRQRSS